MDSVRPKKGGKGSRGLFVAEAVGNQAVCRDHFRIELAVRDFPPSAPGQFVQIGCDQPRDQADEPDLHGWASPNDPGLRTRSLIAPLPLLRRPFSLAGARIDPAGSNVTVLEIIGRAIGLGTSRLAKLQPGERVDLLGPLGNSFPMPPAGATALLVGGGVGIPPMIYLAERISQAGGKAIAVAGVTSGDLLPLTVDGIQPTADSQPEMCVREFSRHGVAAVVSTDDGSLGVRGLVTAALDGVLDGLHLLPDRLVVYTCGPERMMRAVAELAMSRAIPVWVAMERSMACGIGTCQSCVCKTRSAGAAEWAYKLVCTDGPVFAGRDIVW